MSLPIAKLVWFAIAGLLVACSDPPPPTQKATIPGAAPSVAGAPPVAAPGAPPPRPGAPAASGSADPEANLPPLPTKEFQEKDFTETDQSRDPFRGFAQLFVNQAKTHTIMQRRSLVDHYALDELKLIGIVTRAPARALLTDPAGAGWIAKVGDFVGKSELVHAGGPTGIDVAVNWRVDRIRPTDVVFIREDPSHPEIPPTTRVLALRTPEEESKILGQSLE
jgi:type IV pilus assembly protein PilP